MEATKYAKEQLVVNPPLQHIKVKEEMESILTESERTELSRLVNKYVILVFKKKISLNLF